jgi:hypothetical protein
LDDRRDVPRREFAVTADDDAQATAREILSELDVRAMFQLAGIEVKRTHRLPNGYWPTCADYYAEECARSPWWLVETPYGLIRLGWRKRVLAIDWESTPCRKVLTNDEVTKEPTMIHAWSFWKAVEYLSTLSAELRAVPLRRAQTGADDGE